MPRKKKETLADLGKAPLEIGATYIVPKEVTNQIVDLLAEPTELEKVEAEMREISPRLPGLKANDSEQYEKVYKRYLWLVEQREALKGS